MPRRASEVTVRVAGTDLTATVVGEGPAVVLLHGFPQTASEWRHLVPVLAARHLVIVPDLRGFGRSRGLGVPAVSRARLARDLEYLLDHLGIGPVAIVGHDWGGIVAYKFALLAPGRLRRLVLIDTVLTRLVIRAAPHFVWFHIPGRAERLLAEDPRAFVGFMLARYALQHEAFPETAVNLHLGTLDNPQAQRAAISYYRHAAPLYRVSSAADEEPAFRRLTADDCRSWWDAGPGHPWWAEVISFAPEDEGRTVEIPAMWIHSAGFGRPPSPRFAAQFENAFPDLEVVSAACGHWVPEEDPALLADVVPRFLHTD